MAFARLLNPRWLHHCHPPLSVHFIPNIAAVAVYPRRRIGHRRPVYEQGFAKAGIFLLPATIRFNGECRRR